MAHEEKTQTKWEAKESSGGLDSLSSAVLRYIPNGLKLRFALRSIAEANKHKASVPEER